MIESKFEASVGMSRKWDAREAGREVAETAIKNLSEPPSFFLLFSTIHYEKYGGFQEFLNGVWDVLPKGTPLIGGTVAGFMNNYGCYTRGASALAVSCTNMDVVIGCGKNTKRSPKKAAKKCTEMIKSNVKESKFSKKLLFVFTSGTMVPSLFGTGQKRVYKTQIPSSVISRLLNASLRISQRGVGREDIILEEISKQMPDFNIIGGSLIDDNRMESNFQFFNNEVFTNSVVCLSINTDVPILMDSQVAVEKTNIFFEVQTTGEKYIIKTIDKKPATKTFFDYLNWPESLMDERLHRRTFFYPILFEKDNEIFPEVIGGLVGNSIICGFEIKSKKLCVGQSSRKILINAIKNNLKNITKNGTPQTSLIIYCAALLETVGRDFFKVQEILMEAYKETPFLLIATGGEDFKIPNKVEKHSNETINMAAFLN
jgi:hypothetical protein